MAAHTRRTARTILTHLPLFRARAPSESSQNEREMSSSARQKHRAVSERGNIIKVRSRLGDVGGVVVGPCRLERKPQRGFGF